jgi:hypothetical protein
MIDEPHPFRNADGFLTQVQATGRIVCGAFEDGLIIMNQDMNELIS